MNKQLNTFTFGFSLITVCDPLGRVILPTAYEVWGKVMFSQASVILFTGGLSLEGGLAGGEVCMEEVCIERHTPPPPRYGASYWNAFSFYQIFCGPLTLLVPISDFSEIPICFKLPHPN